MIDSCPCPGLLLILCFRALDEKAALQRQREAEAEAKLQAKKAALASGSRVPDRTAPIRPAAPERSESSDRQAPPGPPRLALPGNKPTWREREEAKKAQQSSGAAPPSAPSTDIATEEVQLPKKSAGYVPPARRSAAEGVSTSRGRQENNAGTGPRAESSAEPTAKWRPGARQDAAGRDDSPADGPTPRFLGGLRGQQTARDASSDSARPISSDGTTRTESPAETLRKPTPGKFVPPHLRNKQ